MMAQRHRRDSRVMGPPILPTTDGTDNTDFLPRENAMSTKKGFALRSLRSLADPKILSRKFSQIYANRMITEGLD
jgi:hypothetical protein